MSIFDRWARRIGENAAREALAEKQPQIRAAIVEAIEPALKRAVNGIVADYYRKTPRFRFIKYMQSEMLRIDPNMTPKRSFETARDTLNHFLADEKIEFGDGRYSWDKGGAIDLIHAYEIDHWERAA